MAWVPGLALALTGTYGHVAAAVACRSAVDSRQDERVPDHTRTGLMAELPSLPCPQHQPRPVRGRWGGANAGKTEPRAHCTPLPSHGGRLGTQGTGPSKPGTGSESPTRLGWTELPSAPRLWSRPWPPTLTFAQEPCGCGLGRRVGMRGEWAGRCEP